MSSLEEVLDVVERNVEDSAITIVWFQTATTDVIC